MNDAENHSSWIDSLDFEGAKAVMREVELGDETTSDTVATDIAVERNVVAKINGSGSRRAFKPRRAAFAGTVSMSFVIVLAFVITFGVGWFGSFYWYQRAMQAELEARSAEFDQIYSRTWSELSTKLIMRRFSDDAEQRAFDKQIISAIEEARDQVEAEKKKLGDTRE